MPSLIKCARCGKKPTVKSNADRGAWSAAASSNPPCIPGNGPRVDVDDFAVNSDFTNGLRADGACESNHSSQRRVASQPRTKPLVGPERFFYDKSSYTGTHIHGGPERVAKGIGTAANQAWKRPETDSDDNPFHMPSRVKEVGPTLLRSPVSPGKARPNSSIAVCARPTSQGRPNSRGGEVFGRPSSRGAGSTRVVGPERFFYDKSSYTGTHANGGPSSVAKGGGTSSDQSWKRR